jgi:hypothetical protein
LDTVKRFGSCVGLGAAAGLADGEVVEVVGVGLAGGGLTEGVDEAAGQRRPAPDAVP